MQVLDRMFEPESSAVSHVGYRCDYGVVIRYHSTPRAIGNEYWAPHWGILEYLELRAVKSVGARLVAMRAQDQKAQFLLIRGGSHFPQIDKWEGAERDGIARFYPENGEGEA